MANHHLVSIDRQIGLFSLNQQPAFDQTLHNLLAEQSPKECGVCIAYAPEQLPVPLEESSGVIGKGMRMENHFLCGDSYWTGIYFMNCEHQYLKFQRIN
jgi:hypothetical protein